MAILNEKVTKEEKKNKVVLTFGNYLDDYFGLIIMVCVLAVLIGSFIFVLYPRFTTTQKTITDAQTLINNEKNEIDAYSKTIDSYLEKYSKISDEDKIKVNDMIAPKVRYSSIYHTDLVIVLSDLLESNGYRFTELNVSQDEKRQAASKSKKLLAKASESEVSGLPPGVFAVNVAVTFEEINYARLKELLTLLENRLRLIDIINVDFNPDSSSATLGLTTYSFRHEDDIEK